MWYYVISFRCIEDCLGDFGSLKMYVWTENKIDEDSDVLKDLDVGIDRRTREERKNHVLD